MAKSKTPIKRTSQSAPRKTGPNGGTHGRRTKAEVAAKNTILADSPRFQQKVLDLVDASLSEYKDMLDEDYKPLSMMDIKIEIDCHKALVETFSKIIQIQVLSAEYLPKAAVKEHWKKTNERLLLDIQSVTSLPAEVEGLTAEQRKQFVTACQQWIRDIFITLGQASL